MTTTKSSCKFFLTIFIILCSTQLHAQEWNQMVDKQLVIISSTKDYATAKKIAQEASKKMKVNLSIDWLKPNKKTGLTFSETNCEEYGYPCYIARGEGYADTTRLITIEYSTAYEGFAKGYYIVVAGVGPPESPSVKSILTLARKYYKDAYVKTTKVWYGCMH